MNDRDARRQRVRKLFDAAFDLQAEAREAFLARECQGDDELRGEVCSLLDALEEAETFLQTPLTLEQDASALIGQQIDQYTVRSLHASGGMGTVYLAEQQQPQRTVALKLLKPTFDRRRTLRRFELEAEMLARLQHPAIAQIYASGAATTPLGTLPYLVMEFVDGKSLTGHARSGSLGLEARLALFQRVCDGVQHAHQRGVIHRDLKPSNILVNHEGQPKILDFGLARAIDDGAQELTAQTRAGEVMGTLPYMSPEQVAGDPDAVDVRTDVYALGVILYELLAGELPLDVGKDSLIEAGRRIREEDPPPLHQLVPALRGDLSAITTKALEKQPARRYQSAAALADDLARTLAHEPIAARPPSRVYQLQKFVRRHKGIVGGLALAFGALMVGALLALSAWRDEVAANRAKAEALVRARREAAVRGEINLILEDMLTAPDAWHVGHSRDARVLDVIDRLSEDIRHGERDAEVRAAVHHFLGTTYRSLGLLEKAEPHCVQAWELRRRALGETHPDTLSSVGSVALLRFDQGLREEGLPLQERCVAGLVALDGDHSDRVLDARNDLALFHHELGNHEVAERTYREILAQRRTRGEAGALDLALALHNLASFLIERREFDEALPLLEEAGEIREGLLGPEHPRTLAIGNAIGSLYRETGQGARAREVFEKTLEPLRRVLGRHHLSTLTVQLNLAYCHAEVEDNEAAIPLLRGITEVPVQRLSNQHLLRLQASTVYGGLLYLQGRDAEAEAAARHAYALTCAALPADHPIRVEARAILDGLLSRMGKLSPSQSLEQYLAAEEEPPPPTDPAVPGSGRFATRLRASGLQEEVSAAYQELVDRGHQLYPRGDWTLALALNRLAHCSVDADDAEEAELLFLESVEMYQDQLGDADPRTQEALRDLVEFYDAELRGDEAEEFRALLVE